MVGSYKSILLKKGITFLNKYYSIDSIKKEYCVYQEMQTKFASRIKNFLLVIIVGIGSFIFSHKELRSHFLLFKKKLIEKNESMPIFNFDYLHRTTANIFNLPLVVISKNRLPTINVLVPAFSYESMSAGFVGVFNLASFIRRCGYNTRLVFIDNFNFDVLKFKQVVKLYSNVDNINDIEIDYIGEKKILEISEYDYSVATVWYTAYFAREIMKQTLHKAPFLYLIQDYESRFYAASSYSAFADNTYDFDHAALFSTKFLQDYFLDNKIGVYGRQDKKKSIFNYFNNATTSTKNKNFIEYKKQQPKKKFAFYSRPSVNRNMFEMGALVIIEAIKKGLFDLNEWEFYGIGLGECIIEAYTSQSDKVLIKNLPRMNLKEYNEYIMQFDFILTLMASPHPSLIPMDFSHVGAIVLTNVYGSKTQDELRKISNNIIAKPAVLEELISGIEEGLGMIEDLQQRLQASYINYPTSWGDSFSDEHRLYLAKVFENYPLDFHVRSASKISTMNVI